MLEVGKLQDSGQSVICDTLKCEPMLLVSTSTVVKRNARQVQSNSAISNGSIWPGFEPSKCYFVDLTEKYELVVDLGQTRNFLAILPVISNRMSSLK